MHSPYNIKHSKKITTNVNVCAGQIINLTRSNNHSRWNSNYQETWIKVQVLFLFSKMTSVVQQLPLLLGHQKHAFQKFLSSSWPLLHTIKTSFWTYLTFDVNPVILSKSELTFYWFLFGFLYGQTVLTKLKSVSLSHVL